MTIVVIDDHPLFREGVIATLSAQPDMHVVAEGTTAGDALRLAGEWLPDILLLDISIPGNGHRVVETISLQYPVTKVVMLTASESEDDVNASLRSGAIGYIVKGVASRELTGILRTIAAGEPYVTPTLAAGLLREMTHRRPSRDSLINRLGELTDREREILELVAGGHRNKEIGARLNITEKTVKHHMTNILQKLQVRTRVEAALLAQKDQ